MNHIYKPNGVQSRKSMNAQVTAGTFDKWAGNEKDTLLQKQTHQGRHILKTVSNAELLAYCGVPVAQR